VVRSGGNATIKVCSAQTLFPCPERSYKPEPGVPADLVLDVLHKLCAQCEGFD